tara:strand:+ start:33249 stop:33503 length:255 start_codon:yes stop_codon:yes gene_type:complete
LACLPVNNLSGFQLNRFLDFGENPITIISVSRWNANFPMEDVTMTYMDKVKQRARRADRRKRKLQERTKRAQARRQSREKRGES